MSLFQTADILLPRDHFEKWSVVACDQFTSQPEYWEQVEKITAGYPSSLKLMLPEAWLGTEKATGANEKINAEMRHYLDEGVFQTVENSFVYVERTLSGGQVRHGLIGALDLEAYDYSPDSVSPVRATEKTVTDRLPPRVAIRRKALLEMPHIMVLIDDKEDALFSSLQKGKEKLPLLYDFDLMQDGGHITGRQVSGVSAEKTLQDIEMLSQPDTLAKKYPSLKKAPVIFAMGDGNHSLAAAKQSWESLKADLSEAEKQKHPARYALVEIVNVQDKAVAFEPIHRLLKNTDPSGFLPLAHELCRKYTTPEKTHPVRFIAGNESFTAEIGGLTIGQLIAEVETFCQNYTASHGGDLDYIHGDETVQTLSEEEANCGVVLPAMDKSELFTSVMESGVFPRKSFSIGRAQDKRYYLECRKIK